MVQRQFLILLGMVPIILGGNGLLSQEAQPAPPSPAVPQGPGPGPHGWGFFKRPPQAPGPMPGSPDHGRSLMADRALMFMLMEVPPAELEKHLAGWPRFRDMSDAEKAQFRKRLEGYRNSRRQMAIHAAKQMGIEVPPDQEEAFIRDFWRGRRKIEETLFREMEPRRRELEGKFREEMAGRYAARPQ